MRQFALRAWIVALLAAGTRIAKLPAIWKCNVQELAAVISIAQRMDQKLHVHAGRERLGNPALPGETSRRAELDRP